MLVLSRGPLDGVRIGRDGFLKVVEIRRNQVRLGFEFPSEVRIVRDELPDDDAVSEPQSIRLPSNAADRIRFLQSRLNQELRGLRPAG